MTIAMLRVIFGFVVACLAAGLCLVLFVYTPLEIATEHSAERAGEVGLLALAAATHGAVFAAPFALIAAAYAEWQRIGSWLYYVPAAVLIAVIGFLAQYRTEAAGEATIVNTYAIIAFLITGCVAGLVYWAVAGRHASGPRPPREEIIPPAKPAGPDGSAMTPAN
ncbi:MAG TPA: hypothetical protein VJ740_07685 [Hyphomicrobiaceae bacterium]|nr:hypothetical protein [Hyphomicrobiaceae bacterium]